MVKTKLVLLIGLATFLTACGGGGGGSNSAVVDPPPEPILIGVFIDGPVAGLHYQTATKAGLTNDNGEFEYLTGETVTFSLGGIQLGAAIGADEINPFDLMGITPPDTARTIRAALDKNDEVTAFNSVLNLAYLLVLLDNDINPDNGLDLSSWHSRLADETLDINQSADDFEQALYYFLQRFAIGERRDIRDKGFALNHLYQSLNLQVNVELLSRASGDKTNDGNVNWIIRYQYDDLGREIYSETDADGDGDLENSLSVEYFLDSFIARTLSRRETDRDRDGVLEYVRTSTVTFNDEYNITSSLNETDYNNDGLIDYRSRETREYAEDGRSLSYRDETDDDGDGPNPINYVDVEISTYDESGNQLTTLGETDEDGDGSIDSTYSQIQSFDENNNYLGRYEEQDENNDGTIDKIHESVLTYDNNGRVLSREDRSDNDGDGTFERIRISLFNYDSANRLIAAHNLDDSDADGSTDSYRNVDFIFDENGNLLSEIESEDSDADGPNLVGTISTYYTYNGFNQRLTKIQEQDRDSDGVVERSYSETYSYDSEGNLITKNYQSDLDGEGPDSRGRIENTNYIYDSVGDLVEERQEFDYQNDGIINRRFTRVTTYTNDGSILTDLETTDNDGDGPILESVDLFEYSYQLVPNALEALFNSRYSIKRSRITPK